MCSSNKMVFCLFMDISYVDTARIIYKTGMCLVYLAVLLMILISGCTLYIVFYFQKNKNFPDSGLSLFSLGVRVCTLTGQVEHQRCSRNCRVQENHKILRKNTIFYEHPVCIFMI